MPLLSLKSACTNKTLSHLPQVRRPFQLSASPPYVCSWCLLTGLPHTYLLLEFLLVHAQNLEPYTLTCTLKTQCLAGELCFVLKYRAVHFRAIAGRCVCSTMQCMVYLQYMCLPAVRARRHIKLQTAVEEALLTIICAVNDKKDHIPPVVSPHLITFPFDITVTG